MAGSLNKVTLIGNLGQDPDIRSLNSGDKVVNLSIATSESWKDKNSGERKERTQWHRIVIFNQGLVKIAEQYLKKGMKIYIEGQLETRSWEQNGEKKYATEVVLRPYAGEIVMLSNAKGGPPTADPDSYGQTTTTSAAPQRQRDELEDEIPF